MMGRIKFRQKTERTILTTEGLKKELDMVKQKGYALDAREMEEHMECVGAPVFGPDGSVMGAISVSSLYKPTEIMKPLEGWFMRKPWRFPDY